MEMYLEYFNIIRARDKKCDTETKKCKVRRNTKYVELQNSFPMDMFLQRNILQNVQQEKNL